MMICFLIDWKREENILILFLASYCSSFGQFLRTWYFMTLTRISNLSSLFKNKMKMSFCWDSINIFRNCFHFCITFLEIHPSHCIENFLIRNLLLCNQCLWFIKILYLNYFHKIFRSMDKNCKLNLMLLVFIFTIYVLLILFDRWSKLINFLNMLINLFFR